MTRRPHPAAEAVAYQGEVWTDTRGYATVSLPSGAGRLVPPLEYSVRDVEGESNARVSGEPGDGRFTIETDQPHVKVAWQVSGGRGHDHEEEA